MRETDLVGLCRGVLEAERPRLELAGFAVTFGPAGEPAPCSPTRTPCARYSATCYRTRQKYSTDRRDIVVEAGMADGRAFFRVLDRGIGIAPEHATRIFREFYRVDDTLTTRVKGTGLGLSIARRIVRRPRRGARVRAARGWGQRVRGRVPVSRRAREAAARRGGRTRHEREDPRGRRRGGDPPRRRRPARLGRLPDIHRARRARGARALRGETGPTWCCWTS